MSISSCHHKAEVLRETEKFERALRLYDKVIEGYLEAKNYEGVAQALQGKVLTYKHLYARKRKVEYLKLAIGSAMSSLEISKKYELKQMYTSAYFRLGEVYRLADNYKEAVKNFEKAYKLGEEEKERGDYLYHLGETLYKKGEKKLGLSKVVAGLKLIEKDKNRLDPFIYNVWKSGALMRLWQIKGEEKYLKMASQIIKKDKRLVIRAKQLKEIRSGKYYW